MSEANHSKAHWIPPILQKFPGNLLVAIAVLIFLGVSIGWLQSGFGNKLEAMSDDADEVRRLPVRVATAEFVTSISQKRKYTGTIRAKQQAALGFEVTGRIASVHCDEGDVVQQGQSLAILDTKALQARRSAINASLSQAGAVLAELKAGPRSQTIESMQAQLTEAQSTFKLAELTLQRRTRLKHSRSISESEFDNAVYSHQAAQARVESFSQQLKELQAGTRIERVNAQAAAVQQLESSLNEIDIQIEKSNLKAPFAGKIVSRMIDPGGIASASVAILKIVDFENLEAVIGLPFETSQSISDSQHEILVGDRTYEASLLAKIQELDPATRTQNAIFQLSSSAGETVIPGQLCQIEIETHIECIGHWVPASALNNGIRGLWSLRVVNPETSRAERCDVEVVYTDGDRALVRGTVKDDALVIVDGTHRIVEGQKVEAITAQSGGK